MLPRAEPGSGERARKCQRGERRFGEGTWWSCTVRQKPRCDDHCPLAHRSALEEVHVESNGEMTLVVGKNAVQLRMGPPPYRRKLEQAVRVVAELDRGGAKPDSIMLDNEARPDRVVVRMR